MERNKEVAMKERLYAIITDGEPSFVKFGISKNPSKRLYAIRNGCPLDMRLLGSVLGSYPEEEKLHKALWEHHIRGEWFACQGAAKEAAEFVGAGDLESLGELITNGMRRRMRANIPFREKLGEILELE